MSVLVYLQAFDDHVRRHGYAQLPEGEGLLIVLESAARQLGIPHMTDADRPVVGEEPEEPPREIEPYPHGRSDPEEP